MRDYRISVTPDDFEDMVQACALAEWRLQGSGSKQYIGRGVRNAVVDEIRKLLKRREREYSFAEVHTSRDVDAAEGAIQLDVILAAVEGMEARRARRVRRGLLFLALHVEGHAWTEIGVRAGLSPGSVKTAAHRAQVEIRKAIRDHF